MKICLDPGHTKGANIGYDRDYREGTAMFTLAEKLKKALEEYDGVQVVITRTLTENPSLSERANIAKKNGCELLVSLHSNAFSKPTACGVSTFYSHKRDSKKLAQALAVAVAESMEKDTGVTYSRGAKTRTYVGVTDGKTYDYYGIIRHAVTGKTVKHAVIVEHGFHTHPKECAWLMEDANLDTLAAVDAKVIADYFDLTKTPAPPAEKPAEKPVDKPDEFLVGDIVSFRSTATTYGGEKPVAIPSWVKRENHTVAAIGTTKNKRAGQVRLLEINSWVKAEDLELEQHGGWTMFHEGDAVKVSGTTRWTSGVSMASWVTKGYTFYIRTLRENGAIAVIGKKVADRIAVTGTVFTKYLKKV